MLTGRYQEARSNCIDLPDDDPMLVKKMLDYFYVLDYESDEDAGLSMVETDGTGSTPATDLTIHDVIRGMVMRLQRALIYRCERECLEALTENNFSYDDALLSLQRGDTGDAVQKDPKQAKQGAENSVM